MAPFTLAGFFAPGIIAGSMVFLGLALVGTCVLPPIFGKETPNISKGDAIRMTLVLNWTACICLYVFWLWTYMHQMIPLINPNHAEKPA